MTNSEDKEKKRYLYLILGVVAVSALMATLLLLIPGSSDKPSAPALTKNQVAEAQSFSESFLMEDGNFGLSTEAAKSNAFESIALILNSTDGQYKNSSIGTSRFEAFSNLKSMIDPLGPTDQGSVLMQKLKGYSPDWSGQFTSYSLDKVLSTPGETEVIDGTTVLSLKVSFTTTTDLYVKENAFGSTKIAWAHYQLKSFETIGMKLSLQRSGSPSTWLLWSINNVQTNPYVLATWSNPDWKTAAPSTVGFQKI